MKRQMFNLLAFAVVVLAGSCESAADEVVVPSQPNAVGVMSQIDAYLVEHRGTEALSNISDACVCEQSDAVIVGLVKCDEQAIRDFKANVTDSPLVRFMQRERIQLPAMPVADQNIPVVEGTRADVSGDPSINLQVGTRLLKSDASGVLVYCGTVAYRGRTLMNGTGFLTVGHTLTLNDVVYAKIRNVYMPVGVCVLQNNGNALDVAFIKSSCTVENTLLPTAMTYGTTLVALPSEGTKVVVYGGETMATTIAPVVGTVIRYSYSFVGEGNVSYTGMVLASYPAKAGDLGGLVMDQTNYTVSGAKPYVLGIHCANTIYGSCFVSAFSIKRAYEFTIY